MRRTGAPVLLTPMFNASVTPEAFLVQVTTSVPGLGALSAVDRLVTTGSYEPKTTSVVEILHF